MKLQQVKLSGFKSFVDNTIITIDGQLVGVVGPNGCGKSNVIDAVRWVLGESSAKQLRGESMADVIFNGSVKRKPVSRATVELIFENSQKLLNNLWNSYNEIAVKRLITRTGESNYYINNQQVRRKDITDLFLGTGVGTKGYAVIEQGMISRIIESKPEDMRLFIEEAAGVSKYRERRKETLQRLLSTTENLQRLEDLHSEMLKQLTNLQEQAKVAEIYQQLNHNLKSQQILITAVKINDANKALNEANQLVWQYEDELRILGHQLEEVNLNLIKEEENKVLKEQVLQELMQQFNEYRTGLARLEERFKHYSDLLHRIESESVDLAAKELEISQNIADLMAQDELIALQQKDNQIKLNEEELIRDESLTIVDEKEAVYDKIAQLFTTCDSEANNLKHELNLLNNSLSHKRQQKNNLVTRMTRLVEERNILDFDQSYHEIKDEIKLISEELAANEQLSLGKNQSLSVLSQTLTAEAAVISGLNTEVASLSAKIETLSHILYEELPVPENNCLANLTEINKLWQHLQVSPGYEIALEVVFGNLLQAKLVDSLQQIVSFPEHALDIWVSGESIVKPESGSLSDQVTINNPKLSALYYYLNKYRIISSVNEYSGLPSGRYGVTLDGHLVTCNYIRYYANNTTQNVLQHRHQLDELQTELGQVNIQLANTQEQYTKLLAETEVLNSDLVLLNSESQQLFTKRHDLELEFTKQQQIYTQNQQYQERVDQEHKLLEQETWHLSADIEALEIQLEDKLIKSEELHSVNHNVLLQKLDGEAALQLARNKLQELDAKLNQLIIDKHLFCERRLNFKDLIEEKQIQLATCRQRLAELMNEREQFDNNDQSGEIIDLQQQVAAITHQIQTVQAQINDFNSRIINLKNQASTLNTNYQRNLEKINQTKFKQQEQQIFRATYQENLASLELSQDQLQEMLNTNRLSLTELGASCKYLEEEIAELGLVNLKAIEDLASASIHQQELYQQMEDLQNGMITLRAAIEQIDDETRKILQTTFDQLNESVMVYFRMLFGGGNARLAMTDKDILQAGVQIFAEPPGKKNATIHLLSGGEKALAAMSFIFALFSLNPAPFCLLDEVDAPLDDANTMRFCNLVKELSAKTQFVYISHNRLSMEMADQLIGVTMQEKGISTIVSVNLVDVIKHLELANTV